MKNLNPYTIRVCDDDQFLKLIASNRSEVVNCCLCVDSGETR